MVLPEQARSTVFVPKPRIPNPENYREYFFRDIDSDDEGGCASAEFFSSRVRWNKPKGGALEFPPIKTKPNEQSNWDESEWKRTSRGPKNEFYNKKKCQKLFLLNDDDMADLCYTKEPIPGRPITHCEHSYLTEEVERRAWEKYGGPQGFAAAKKLAAEKQKAKRINGGTPSPKKHAGTAHAHANSINS
ncbi:hypothetical protein JR316_0010044 [Psilocybe cubensis]|uniref:Uncharacterized protein n=2 Tax=Psilocybe cubensis TaxID=181762 RepID=A0A8H7XNT4_PSICU|nr:hypothetical protein JR316_0010044 [Psilocybe cubensis]KAH9477815.1 hypothetical protein JR316_0010044 [Psilocybe cubensis]